MNKEFPMLVNWTALRASVCSVISVVKIDSKGLYLKQAFEEVFTTEITEHTEARSAQESLKGFLMQLPLFASVDFYQI